MELAPKKNKKFQTCGHSTPCSQIKIGKPMNVAAFITGIQTMAAVRFRRLWTLKFSKEVRVLGSITLYSTIKKEPPGLVGPTALIK